MILQWSDSAGPEYDDNGEQWTLFLFFHDVFCLPCRALSCTMNIRKDPFQEEIIIMSNYLTIDVGGTNIKYALMNDEIEVIEKGEVPTPRDSL